MPAFDYKGRNAEGQLVQGKRVAQSSENLGEQLLKEGIFPIHIAIHTEQVSGWARLKDIFRGKQFALDELAMFSRQMYTLTKTGVPITYAIKQLANNARSLSLATALNEIVENLEAGRDLASSMQTHPEIFSPLIISMIRIGENSGRLDEAFLRLNQYLQLESDALKKVKTALRYPMLVLVAIVIAIILINIFVIPTFATVFAQAHLQLPPTTRLLISISNFIRNFWWILLIIFGGLIGLTYYYLKTPEGKYFWGKTQLKLPIIGPLLKKILLLRFAQTFSIAVNSGIPMVEGIALVGDALNNEYERQEFQKLQESISHGKTLTQAAITLPLFTPLELQMFSVSEETGELGNLLLELSQYYKREVDYDLSHLTDLIEPILILGLAIIILGLAFAVYLPMWNLIKIVHF